MPAVPRQAGQLWQRRGQRFRLPTLKTGGSRFL